MKKFLSLVIISMIAVLSFAQAPVQVKKAKTNKIEKVFTTAQLQKGMEAKAKAAAAKEQGSSVLRQVAKNSSALKMKNGVASVAKAKHAATVSGAKMAPKNATPKTEGEYEDLEATSYSAEYYPSDGDWFCVLTALGIPFRFDIVTNNPEPLNGTYTFDQMDEGYSWAGQSNSTSQWAYEDATFTVNADGTEVEAYVTLDSGEKFHITYSKPAVPEPTETVTFNFDADHTELVDLVASDGIFQFVGVDEATGLEAYIAIKSSKIVGNYTMDNAYAQYCTIYPDADDFVGVQVLDLNGSVVATEDGYKATFTVICSNAIEYVLTFNYVKPDLSNVPLNDLTAELPYLNTFDTEEEQFEAAIFDANGDGSTFKIVNDTNTGSMTARYSYSTKNDADDYVVFPALELTAGVEYLISVDARANSYDETVEILVGNASTTAAMTTPVIAPTVLSGKDYQTLTGTFTPAVSGNYNFAIHAISEADAYYLYADNFSVKANDMSAPASVTDLEIVPDATAALKADVKFTTPSVDVAGNAIAEEVVKVTVKRNGELVDESVMPCGSEMTVTDAQVPAPGYYTYTVGVATVDGAHDGETVSAKAYVGEDIPEIVENILVEDLNDKVGLSWTPVTEGVNGGIIIPENIVYNVYPVEMVEFFGMQFPVLDEENPIDLGVEGTNYEFEYATNEGPQGYTYFGVAAENGAGVGEGGMGAVLLGAPYDLPFVENFNGGSLSYWWGVDYDDNIYYADGGIGIDEDAIVYDAPCEGWIELMSGKIALNGAENPALSFSYKTDAAATLQIKVISPEGEEIVGLLPVENTEWATANIDLSFYADQPWIRFNIVGNFEEATNLYVDNLIVMNMVNDDLEIAVSAPKSVVTGQSATVKATVKNVGQNVASEYDVKFYINDVEAPAPLFEIVPLAFMETAEYEFELETSLFDEPAELVVKAEVVYAADVVPATNVDEVLVDLVAPSATPVKSVTAVQNEAATVVTISWEVEENASQEVTEDFEAYEAGIYSDDNTFGSYMLHDGDNLGQYGISDLNWAYGSQKYAVGIADFEDMGMPVPAVSGQKAAIFMSSYEGQNDDWMISPVLTGEAQTISFNVMPLTTQYGAEKIEVLVSTTDANPASFTSLQKINVNTADWKNYEIALPEGAMYFAIRYVSDDIFGLFLDDLTYVAGANDPTGFNIYIDEALVAAVDADAREYYVEDDLSEGDHTFSVTAVYGATESAPVSDTIGVATAIKEINSAKNVEIYTIDGIRVNNITKAGVYVVNGKKTVVK